MKASLTPLYGNLAAVATSTKDWPACIEQCDKVLRSDRDNVKALYRKGVALGKIKEFDDAISCLKKAVALDATNVASKRALRDVVQAKKTQKKEMKATFGGMSVTQRDFRTCPNLNLRRRRRRDATPPRRPRRGRMRVYAVVSRRRRSHTGGHGADVREDGVD